MMNNHVLITYLHNLWSMKTGTVLRSIFYFPFSRDKNAQVRCIPLPGVIFIIQARFAVLLMSYPRKDFQEFFSPLSKYAGKVSFSKKYFTSLLKYMRGLRVRDWRTRIAWAEDEQRWRGRCCCQVNAIPKLRELSWFMVLEIWGMKRDEEKELKINYQQI